MADDIAPIWVVLKAGNRPHRPHAGSTYSVSAFRNEGAAQRSAKATGGDVVEFVPRGSLSDELVRAVVAGIDSYIARENAKLHTFDDEDDALG